MARRIGKRKRQEREEYIFKEREKVDTGIFNTRTMVYLGKFINGGVIETIKFITARGKEADVYIATAGGSELVKRADYVVVKFFRVMTSSFYRMNDYVIGDPRFKKMTHSRQSIIKIWCRKEYGNLELANFAGVNAPKPYMFNGSILAMQFIGDKEGRPAPQLKDVELDNPKEMLNRIIEQLHLLYMGNLVHADVSEYNILVKDGRPYLIDFGQGVVLKHPNAERFLERDVNNILSYFSKRYHVLMETFEAIQRIKG